MHDRPEPDPELVAIKEEFQQDELVGAVFERMCHKMPSFATLPAIQAQKFFQFTGRKTPDWGDEAKKARRVKFCLNRGETLSGNTRIPSPTLPSRQSEASQSWRHLAVNCQPHCAEVLWWRAARRNGRSL